MQKSEQVAPNLHISRKLRVAFTTRELLYLNSLDPFRAALQECDGAPEKVDEVIRIGGALLNQKDHRASALKPPERRDAA